jgi:hypothetical protein
VTPQGTLVTAQGDDGRWVLGFEGESLDSHPSPEDAAVAAGNGACRWPSIGSPMALGVPAELEHWSQVATRIKRRNIVLDQEVAHHETRDSPIHVEQQFDRCK